MKNWDLDQLKAQLSNRPEVKGWVVTQEHVHRRVPQHARGAQPRGGAAHPPLLRPHPGRQDVA